MEQKDLA
jgi:hypothetical protein